MSASTNKSRPVYTPLRLDPAGKSHLILSDLHELPAAAFAATPEADELEIWLNGNKVTEAAATGALRKFRAVADMLANLRHRLRRAPVGLRLYAIGTEAFLWDVHNLGREAGLGRGEIFLTQAGSLRRRVYCAHCKTMNEDVTTSVVACVGCGAALFVRDHFSRRLAAFMGVAVNAENPVELPDAEVLYS